MKKHFIFTIINLIFFITCNIIINYITGGLNILFTVLFYATWLFALIGIYFVIHDYVNQNKIGPLDSYYDLEHEQIESYINDDYKTELVDELLKKYPTKAKLLKYDTKRIVDNNKLKYKESLFFSYQNEHTTGVYLSYQVCIILFLCGVLCFISYFYFEKFSIIQYLMFTLINGVILVSQILVRFLIDLGIIRFKFK